MLFHMSSFATTPPSYSFSIPHLYSHALCTFSYAKSTQFIPEHAEYRFTLSSLNPQSSLGLTWCCHVGTSVLYSPLIIFLEFVLVAVLVHLFQQAAHTQISVYDGVKLKSLRMKASSLPSSSLQWNSYLPICFLTFQFLFYCMGFGSEVTGVGGLIAGVGSSTAGSSGISALAVERYVMEPTELALRYSDMNDRKLI